jgi:enolase
MIDFLVKLVTDKPIITYLEDPLAATELAAWKKLKVTYIIIQTKL